MGLLITRPKHDAATHYLFHWSTEIVDNANEKGLRTTDLQKNKANKRDFQSYLKKNVHDIVIINGHGDASSACGEDNEELLSVGDGDDLFKNKKVFIRACDCGAVLGPKLVEKGAKGFIGYAQPYIFLTDKDSVHEPLKDELASPVLDCSNQVARSLLKGKSIQEAHEDSLRMYQEKIDQLSTSNSAKTYLLPFLNWNRAFQVAIGS